MGHNQQRGLVAAGLLAFVLLPSSGHSAEAAAGSMAAAIDAYLRPFVETNSFSGVVHAARGERELFRKGYGMASYELGVPNAPETRFHIASVSKSFTAAAILLLEERGKLNTSDAISKLVPDYPNGDKIQLEHLLTHGSGIPNVNELPEYRLISRFPQTAAELVALFRDKRLEFEPGARFRYSNSNYNVLALVTSARSSPASPRFRPRSPTFVRAPASSPASPAASSCRTTTSSRPPLSRSRTGATPSRRRGPTAPPP